MTEAEILERLIDSLDKTLDAHATWADGLDGEVDRSVVLAECVSDDLEEARDELQRLRLGIHRRAA